MVDLAQAREIALSRMSDKTWFDHCVEYDNAFVFSRYDDMSFGGISPCAVIKTTGAPMNYAAVLDALGAEIAEYAMSPDGVFTDFIDDVGLNPGPVYDRRSTHPRRRK